ncbi:hypothetical protein, partial [Rhizobium leucaenae]|uniref:hypothetical protein n=1 Tax=Rhizobium leucaenae TaxID=29450 RepID=UPI001AECB8E4
MFVNYMKVPLSQASLAVTNMQLSASALLFMPPLCAAGIAIAERDLVAFSAVYKSRIRTETGVGRHLSRAGALEGR